MYSTCMFCSRPLGANEVLETFPVGRRLAFDAECGRLWVVCTKCARWNLSPIEERWEAVEDCERIYRKTRTRVSTENIGLARLREGLELVRIGRPVADEFAAWRYGDQFGRRRKKAMIYGAAGVAVFGAFVVGGAWVGVAGSSVLSQSGNIVNLIVNGRTRVRIRGEDGKVIKLKGWDLQRTKLLTPAQAGDWRLEVGRKRHERTFIGDTALNYAGKVMPGINQAGGSPKVVEEAVARIEAAGGPEPFLLAGLPGSDVSRGRARRAPAGMVNKHPRATRLALEMALHEEQERRAMEGELWLLELAWQEDEEIAAISDGLLLPEGAKDFLEEHHEAHVIAPTENL
jgi:hypothetical protein